MNINITYNYSFSVWLTVLTESYADLIISGLVRKGYSVSTLDNNGEVSVDKHSTTSALIALKVSSVSEKIMSADIHVDIINILDDIKAYYHSVIVTPYVDCVWCGSNILLNKAMPPVMSPLPVPDKSNLN